MTAEEALPMHLYNFDVSPFAARCRLAIYRKALPIEIVPPPEGGPRSDEYRALNPMGKVPALVLDDGAVIPESEVILEYLEDRFPDPALRPELPEARARMRLLSRIGDLYLMPPMGRLFGQTRPETRDASVVDAAMTEVGQALDFIEHFIAPDGWSASEGCSLADCTLVPLLFLLTRLLPGFGLTEPLASRPKTRAYWRRVQADPVVARVLAEMEAGLARMAGRG
jgi:glutathione S-transferase